MKLELTSYYATDMVCALLMITLLLSRGWRIQTRRAESRILLALILATLAGCTLDSLAWVIDGRPGMLNRVAVFACNTLLFMLNLLIGPGYVTIIARHIHETMPKWHDWLIAFIIAGGGVLLVINVFVPIVFSLDENNVYHRESLFWIYMTGESVLVAYGLAIYLTARLRGRLLRFFPAWQFVLPIVLGLLIQSRIYGVSLIWVCAGISFCALIICLQNESIYLDKLTGVYNRFYLDDISEMLKKRRHGRFAALMLDMNGFKAINDRYSHAEGDAALIVMAGILTDAVRSSGVVVRFAGDEFVLVLDRPTEHVVEEYRERIGAAVAAYNATSGKPYQLAVAVGGRVFDTAKDDISDFLTDIDHSMYEDKRAYYMSHDRRERRQR